MVHLQNLLSNMANVETIQTQHLKKTKKLYVP